MEQRYELPAKNQEPPPSYELATNPPPSEQMHRSQQSENYSNSLIPAGLPHATERLYVARTASSSRLQKPIAIPATSKKLGSPFLRAYPPSLEQFMLPKEIFLRFVDDLNRIAVANPPLQVLGLAGSVVSMVPLQTAQIVGGAVNAATTLGVVALSKGRTEVFLRTANKEIFQPRGLKVEIAKLDAVARLAGMPILDEMNKISKKAAVLPVIEDLESQQTVSGQDRRLQALEPWIAQLELTPLPEIEIQKNPLSRLNAAASERQRKKEEKKLVKDRHKAQEDYDKDSAKAIKDYEKEMAHISKEERKIRTKEDPDKVDKKLRELEKEKAKVEKEYEKEMGKVTRDRLKDDKEEESVRKILWLIIRNLDAQEGSDQNPYLDHDEAQGRNIGTSMGV